MFDEGMLSNSKGEMVGLWANYNEQKGSDDMQEYCRGLPLVTFKPWVDKVPLHPCLLATAHMLLIETAVLGLGPARNVALPICLPQRTCCSSLLDIR